MCSQRTGRGQVCICQRGSLRVHPCPPKSPGQISETRPSRNASMHTWTPPLKSAPSAALVPATGLDWTGPRGVRADALCFQEQPSSTCFSLALLGLLYPPSAWHKAEFNHTGSCCLRGRPRSTPHSVQFLSSRLQDAFVVSHAHTCDPMDVRRLPDTQQIWALLSNFNSHFSLFLE